MIRIATPGSVAKSARVPQSANQGQTSRMGGPISAKSKNTIKTVT
jgi:hypothetical protein